MADMICHKVYELLNYYEYFNTFYILVNWSQFKFKLQDKWNNKSYLPKGFFVSPVKVLENLYTVCLNIEAVYS
jgi:hypothetical protein